MGKQRYTTEEIIHKLRAADACDVSRCRSI